MRKTIKFILVASVLLLAALSGPTATTTAGANIASATGGGHYLIGGALDVQFAFAAIQHADGTYSGVFHHSTADETGKVDFDARVTCLAVDKELGRAWIGGVIVANRSTSPDFQRDIHQPGRDIWFRVLDGGKGKDNQQSRTTFIGFEGVIPSSAAYCAGRPWPDGNARTWPVNQGTVNVH